MRVVRSVAAMQRIARDLKRRGRIGFVPTMGFLHEGHLRLVRTARRQSDFVVVSIFVNPIQFGPTEDFRRYPRDFGRDRRLLQSAGADFIFYPGVKDMYPEGFATFVDVERLGEGLCGKSRPGHFRGVTTVVAKLFNVVLPDVAVFGAKDAQQAFVIRRMVRDLNFQTRIVILPTAREKDGLAMSSRNMYLKGDDRIAARCLSRGLFRAKELFGKGERDAGTLVGAARAAIDAEPLAKPEYAEGRDPVTLTPLSGRVDAVTILVAAKVGPARLIDNITLGQ